MTLADAKKKFIFTTKVFVDETNTDWIELREPTISEFQKFSEDGNKNLETMKNLFPHCVVDSSFTYDAEGKTKATGQQLYEVFSDSSTCFTKILQDWFNACPFAQTKKNNKK